MAKTTTKTETTETVNEAPTATNELAQVAQTSTDIVVADIDFAADAGSTQDFSQTDLKIPFIKIVQELTPESKKNRPEYVEGCEAGMMMDGNSKRLFSGDKGILFIPFAFTHDVTEWKPKRGGLAAMHGKDESLFKTTRRNDQNEDILPNGNTLLLSYVYYGLRVDEDEQSVEPAVLAYSKTAIKHARSWNTVLSTTRVKQGARTFVPAMYYFACRITVGMETDGSNTWYVPKFKIEMPTIELGKRFGLLNGIEVYNEAKQLREMWEKGQVQADMTQMSNQGEGGAGAGANLPF